MFDLLERLGIRVAFAPEDDKGANGDGGSDGGGNGGADGNGGAGAGGGGSGGGSSDTGAGGSQQSRLKDAGGLLGTRKAKEGSDGGDNGANGGAEPKPGADGRPAHIPEKFWDAEKKAVKVDDIGRAYADLEKNFGKLKREKGVGDDVPEKPEEYFAEPLKLEGAERFGQEIPIDDPGLKSWGKVCHKYGIGKDAAMSIARDMFKEMNGFAPEPIDLEAEREDLGDGADELVDGVFTWLEAQERDGKLGADDIDVAVAFSNTAKGIRFLNKMRTLSGAKPIPIGLPAGSKGLSQEDWHSEMRAAVKAKDYKRQAELDEMSERIFGNDQASGSPIAGIPNQKDVDRTARK
jgi:hypothetical protein